jgi:hypothetical protein
MNVINLTCNHCGAPLEVAEQTKFATCRFCSSRLAIEHSESAFYTRVLEALENHTTALSQDLETIKIQNEIERLDREWEMQREPLCRRTKSGQIAEPSVSEAGCLGAFQIVFGVVWFSLFLLASTASDYVLLPGFLSFIGLFIALSGIVVFKSGVGKARHFESVRSEYELRRSRLVADLGRRNGITSKSNASPCDAGCPEE